MASEEKMDRADLTACHRILRRLELYGFQSAIQLSSSLSGDVEKTLVLLKRLEADNAVKMNDRRANIDPEKQTWESIL